MYLMGRSLSASYVNSRMLKTRQFQLRSDNEYIAAHDLHVRMHSADVAATYLYNFAHRAANHTIPEWIGEL